VTASSYEIFLNVVTSAVTLVGSLGCGLGGGWVFWKIRRALGHRPAVPSLRKL